MELKQQYSDLRMTIRYLFILILGVIFLEIIQQTFSLNSNPSLKLISAFEKRRFEMIIEAILFAPLIEELIFRLPIKKTNLFLISIFLSLILISNFNTTIGIIVCVSIGLFNLIILIYQVISKNDKFIEYFYIISIGVFTISHLNNYSAVELDSKSYVELMILFLPQLLLGIFCTIIRVKSNIWYSVLLHSLYNGILITFAIIQT